MGCFGGVGSYVQSFAAGTQQFWLTLPSTPFGLEMPPEACVLAVLAVLPADGLPPPTSASVGSGASYVDVVTYPPTWKIYILQAPASCGDLTYDGASDEIYCNYGGGNLPLQLTPLTRPQQDVLIVCEQASSSKNFLLSRPGCPLPSAHARALNVVLCRVGCDMPNHKRQPQSGRCALCREQVVPSAVRLFQRILQHALCINNHVCPDQLWWVVLHASQYRLIWCHSCWYQHVPRLLCLTIFHGPCVVRALRICCHDCKVPCRPMLCC